MRKDIRMYTKQFILSSIGVLIMHHKELLKVNLEHKIFLTKTYIILFSYIIILKILNNER